MLTLNLVAWLVGAALGQLGVPLADQLAAEAPASIARAAREEGDPARGALLFQRPYLGCATCHEPAAGRPPIGPDLATPGAAVTDAHLIEGVLEPSRELRRGYETQVVQTADGRTLSGVIVEERPDALVLRDPARPEEPLTIDPRSIEARAASGVSAMPAGLVNALASRGEFLDLLSYLRAIAEGGPARARALRPDPAALAADAPPDEADLDHARLISAWDSESLDRGREIYDRHCASCHGYPGRPGSMPTSLDFATGTFKNGSDPLALYRTLTRGFGQMPPQGRLVARQKYDVIHFLRETFLKPSNPSQYRVVDDAYRASLPRGGSLGPEPRLEEPWRTMNYGSSLMATIEAGSDGSNIACKGIAVRVDPGPGGIAGGRRFLLYDHDTMRLAAAWQGEGFLNWEGINFDGRHEVHPKRVGPILQQTRDEPGWARPSDGRFDDPRPRDREGRRYGPLPADWMRYRGLYHHGDSVVLSYEVGGVPVLERPGCESESGPVFSRTIEVTGRSPHDLTLRVGDTAGLAVAVLGEPEAQVVRRGVETLVLIPAGACPTVLKVLFVDGDPTALRDVAGHAARPESLRPLTAGGPPRWPEVLMSRVRWGRADRAFALDVLAHPEANPWDARMRFSGIDFFADGRRAAVCGWDGDVWIVSGLDDPEGRLTWRRIASGLFQPLGLVIADEQIFVTCRDQIARLRDLNGDQEIDFVECFNTDHQVTPSFHEFALDLQRDSAGRFYYTKSARHGRTATVPQHGTLLRVAADGSATDILATGFRAPNGLLRNPDGTFFVTDQEGHWIPKNRVNWVRPGGFYGNFWGSTPVRDPSDAAMDPPVCWITNAFDRSPSEIIRVPAGAWGPLGGSLLTLSYGYGKMFTFPHERVDDQLMQGGLAPLPVPQVPTGLVRGRFGADGHLYVGGLFGWASNQEQAGGLYRVRWNGRPANVVLGLSARTDGLAITFSDPIDPSAAAEASRYAVRVWDIRRSASYGSPHRDEHALNVRGARPLPDGRSVLLDVEGLGPTRCIATRYEIAAADGTSLAGTIHHTIHRLIDPAPAGTANPERGAER